LSIVSRDVDRDPNSEFEKRRAERYIAKIGVDASSPITILGVPLQLVDRDDGALQTAVPSIIEGFPLAKVLPCMEAAAVAFAVRGRSDTWDGLRWLCYLNEVDPRETADALRQLSSTVRRRGPETGVHRDLPARAAALLLWLIGQEIDEEAAASIDPGIDRVLTYERDYLLNPSRSFFPLERRHADAALSEQGVALITRIQRAKTFWPDPTFQAPKAFVDELRSVAARFDVATLNRGGGYSAEDHFFEELEPVLARCAPDLLKALVQRKLQSNSTCPAEARYWSAISAPRHFILAGDTEKVAAQSLRMSARDSDDGQEAFAASGLFMIELQELDTLSQFETVIAAGLKFISTDFREVLNTPTLQEVDELIARYRDGTSQQQHDLILLLSVNPIRFSDEAWAWLTDLARQSNHQLRGVLFRTLAIADSDRFGKMLIADGWSWHPMVDLWVNHYGTGVLIEAGTALPFDQLASRLAPWRLLEAARVRGADVAEVRLAAEIFGHILAAERIEEPDPGADLSLERSETESTPFVISVEPRSSGQEQNDPFASLRAAMDTDARVRVHRRATETAISRVNEARTGGASLYLTDVDPDDLEPVLRHAPEMVDRWLEGYREHTNDFRRRVRLAEAAYLALCEVLLARDPSRGAELWRGLRKALITRYIGPAGVEELLHMVFRAPESRPVAALRDELVDLKNCQTDQDLFKLAVAASYNGKAAWLASIVEADRASGLVWRQKRALVLNGFVTANTLSVDGAWPSGEVRTHHAKLRHRSAYRRLVEGCAHHWWRSYLAAGNPVDGYAAWILFLESADPRAWVWMWEDVRAQINTDAFFDRKIRHVRLNRSRLERAMAKKLETLDRTFLGHETVNGIGPWGVIERAS
jgi:hypothetical protein